MHFHFAWLQKLFNMATAPQEHLIYFISNGNCFKRISDLLINWSDSPLQWLLSLGSREIEIEIIKIINHITITYIATVWDLNQLKYCTNILSTNRMKIW